MVKKAKINNAWYIPAWSKVKYPARIGREYPRGPGSQPGDIVSYGTVWNKNKIKIMKEIDRYDDNGKFLKRAKSYFRVHSSFFPINKRFKTEQQAFNYAKAYMRKH